jgi:hypothetical protein
LEAAARSSELPKSSLRARVRARFVLGERERETGNSFTDLGKQVGDRTPECGGERRLGSLELAPMSFLRANEGGKQREKGAGVILTTVRSSGAL